MKNCITRIRLTAPLTARKLHHTYLVLFLRLLTTQGYLRGHHALTFGDQRAFSASTILPATIALVTLDEAGGVNGAVSGAVLTMRKARFQSKG